AAIPVMTTRAASTRSRAADALLGSPASGDGAGLPAPSFVLWARTAPLLQSEVEFRIFEAHEQVTPLLERDRCLQAAALRRHPPRRAADPPRARPAPPPPLRGAAVRDRGRLRLGPVAPD